MGALTAAAAKFFSVTEVPALDLAGSTDSGIVRGLHDHFGVPHTAEGEGEFYDIYLSLLDRALAERGGGGQLLPGVPELLEAVGASDDFVVGLLTGNIARGAAKKIEYFGIAEYFSFGAYGDDHHDRNKLGPVALARAGDALGTGFQPEQTVVVGDTPKDIWCGQALEAMTVAVATGKFTVAELRGHKPDHVFENLSDTAAVLSVFR